MMSKSAFAVAEEAIAEAVADENASWPQPDLSLLFNEERKPPEFDRECLPAQWATWCIETAHAKACPVDYVALNLIITASVCLGNSRRLAASGDWQEPPHLWGAIVGPPSGGKTPSQQPFTGVCKQLEKEDDPAWQVACADYEKRSQVAEAARKIWEGEVKTALKKGQPAPDMPAAAVNPEPPAKARLMLMDGTTQEMINILAGNPKGLLLLRDELAGWIGSFDRYSGSGADRGFYLESWNGGRYSVDLVKYAGKSISVPYASLGILGGIQPDKLREALSGADDGFAARFVYIWPALVPYAPLSTENFGVSERRRLFLLDAMRVLRQLAMDESSKGNPLAVEVPLSAAALQLFEEIRETAIAKARSTKGLAAGWHGKTPARALRLALTLEYLNWATSPQNNEPVAISAEAMAWANDFLEYLEGMFERVISGLAGNGEESDAAEVMELIYRHKWLIINERQMYQTPGLAHFRNTARRAAALKVLQKEGWIRQKPASGTGRKRGDWLVNPLIWEKT